MIASTGCRYSVDGISSQPPIAGSHRPADNRMTNAVTASVPADLITRTRILSGVFLGSWSKSDRHISVARIWYLNRVSRYSNKHIVIRSIMYHNCSSADFYMISQANRAKHNGIGPKCNIISNKQSPLRHTFSTADTVACASATG